MPTAFKIMLGIVVLAALAVMAGTVVVTHRLESCVLLLTRSAPTLATWEAVNRCQRPAR